MTTWQSILTYIIEFDHIVRQISNIRLNRVHALHQNKPPGSMVSITVVPVFSFDECGAAALQLSIADTQSFYRLPEITPLEINPRRKTPKL